LFVVVVGSMKRQTKWCFDNDSGPHNERTGGAKSSSNTSPHYRLQIEKKKLKRPIFDRDTSILLLKQICHKDSNLAATLISGAATVGLATWIAQTIALDLEKTHF
jgi:hypothetical protein